MLKITNIGALIPELLVSIHISLPGVSNVLALLVSYLVRVNNQHTGVMPQYGTTSHLEIFVGLDPNHSRVSQNTKM